jgi:hypothetical protein
MYVYCMYVPCILFHCVVLCTVFVKMCTVLLPPGVNPIAVNKTYQYYLTQNCIASLNYKCRAILIDLFSPDPFNKKRVVINFSHFLNFSSISTSFP